MLRPHFPVLALAAASLLGSCSSWRTVQRYDDWTLYAPRDRAVDEEAYEAAFRPALVVVEEHFGEFEKPVRVHAWHGAVDISPGGRRAIEGDEASGVQDVPGIGPARVQAYHARGKHSPFAPTGIFIGTPDPGTALHELVHARLAELDADLPLWFEEGVASFFGDGALFEGEWHVDGFACWPWRELSEETLTYGELARLMAIRGSQDASVRDNVLVHFIGWAVVFDLFRETGSYDWRVWVERFDEQNAVEDAARRMRRTLERETVVRWLRRLDDEDTAVRLAAACGTWKLRSPRVFQRLSLALERETHPEVRVALAVNALAAAGELRLHSESWRAAQGPIMETFRDVELDDVHETTALRELWLTYHATHRGDAEDALERLARFWEE